MLLRKADYLMRVGQDSASWQLLEKLAQENKGDENSRFLAQLIAQKADWYYYHTNYDTSFILSKQSLEYAQKYELKELVPRLMLQAGEHALRKFDYDQVLDYCSKAKELAKKQEQEIIVQRCDICLSEALHIYYADATGDAFLEESLAPFRRSLPNILESGDTSIYIRYFLRYTDIFRLTGKVDSIQLLINHIDQIMEQYPDYRYMAASMIMKAILAHEKNEVDRIHYYLTEALAFSKRLNIPKTTQHYYYRLFEHFFNDRNEYQQALIMLDSATEVKGGLAQFDQEVHYYHVYRALENYPMALAYLEKWMEIREARTSKERMAFMTEWETKYNTQEKEAKLAKQAYFRNTLLIILGLIFLFGSFLVRALISQRKTNKKLQQQNTLIEQQTEELKKLDQLKSHFFANISHELRTPLTLIKGPIQTVLKSNQLNNRNFTLLSHAKQSTNSLNQLIDEILDLTKLEQTKMELLEAPVILYELVLRIASSFESLAQSNHQHFEFQYLPDRLLRIQLDRDKFEKILNNLLSNAFKFTPPTGTICLSVEELPHQIQIKLTDSGRGIHPDDLPYIFDRFYQTKRPDAASEGGTGIGLALSREFVRMMDGELRVESTLGEGSTFYFEFPKRIVLGSPLKEELAKLESIENRHLQDQVRQPIDQVVDATLDEFKPRLLLVEDNIHLRGYLIHILGAHYHLQTAENGKIALEKLQAQLPDLIVSDIMMPEMDGFQLLKHLKSTDHFLHLPVIMLTARAQLEDKIKALRIGVDDYLNKPFEEEELLARIENLLLNAKNRNAQLLPKEEEAKSESTFSAHELQWLQEQEQLLLSMFEDDRFSVSFWANEAAMSERQLQRKLKKITGLTPQQYLLELRLNKARQFLEQGSYASVGELAQAVGFSSTQQLSRNFKKRFGKLPSSYY